MQDLLKDMIDDIKKKIDSSDRDFCATPLVSSKKLNKYVAESLILGDCKSDEILHEVTKKDQKHGNKCKKGCSH